MSSIKKVRMQNEIKLEAKINLPRSFTIKIWDSYNSKKKKRKKKGRGEQNISIKLYNKKIHMLEFTNMLERKYKNFISLLIFFYVDYKIKDSYDDTYKWW